MIGRALVPGQPFKIISLKACDPPAMAQGNDWYRYVIGQDNNRIEGYRQGRSETVTQAVEQMVEQLNERRLGKRGVPRAKPGPKKAQ